MCHVDRAGNLLAHCNLGLQLTRQYEKALSNPAGVDLAVASKALKDHHAESWAMTIKFGTDGDFEQLVTKVTERVKEKLDKEMNKWIKEDNGSNNPQSKSH